MSCINCTAPACGITGYAWRASSSEPADVEAFAADVVTYMQMTGERQAGKACAAVFRSAMAKARERCLLK